MHLYSYDSFFICPRDISTFGLQALIGLGNADEAIPVLKQVLDLVPHSAMVASELQLARTMQQNERERWSRVARRMSPHTNYAKRNVSFRRFSSLRSLLVRFILFLFQLIYLSFILLYISFFIWSASFYLGLVDKTRNQ